MEVDISNSQRFGAEDAFIQPTSSTDDSGGLGTPMDAGKFCSQTIKQLLAALTSSPNERKAFAEL